MIMILKIYFETDDHDNQSDLSVNNNEAEDVEGKGRKVNLQFQIISRRVQAIFHQSKYDCSPNST